MSTIITAPAKESTPKSKPELAPKMGISLAKLEEMNICWVPFPMTQDEKALIGRVMQARSTDKQQAWAWNEFSKVLRAHLDAELPKYEEEAKQVAIKLAKEKTTEELEKEVLKIQKQLEATLAALGLKK